MLDINKIRKDFPILNRKIGSRKLIYFDNAATSQKPKAVIDSIADYYLHHNANIHRGIHTLAEEATSMSEKARENVAGFLGAKSGKEIVFVRNATEGINLVANTFGLDNFRKGDEILITAAEHHSNIVPWQMVAAKKGAVIKIVPLNTDFEADLNELKRIITKKTKMISVVHVSNVLGSENKIGKICEIAKKHKIKVLIDGTQSVPRMKVDVSETGCDFFVATGHKMLGPTGIGVLWAKEDLFESMSPYMGGGDMIKEVSFRSFLPNDPPFKFEAGTPNISGAIALGEAVSYLRKIGMNNIHKQEKEITAYALEKMRKIKGIKIYGSLNPEKRIGVISFNIDLIHPHDLSQYLDREGIAVRSGHHCAMPLHKEVLKISSSTRVSFYIYNSKDEVDIFIEALKKAIKFFIHG